jgi:hypothetical protein
MSQEEQNILKKRARFEGQSEGSADRASAAEAAGV